MSLYMKKIFSYCFLDGSSPVVLPHLQCSVAIAPTSSAMQCCYRSHLTCGAVLLSLPPHLRCSVAIAPTSSAMQCCYRSHLICDAVFKSGSAVIKGMQFLTERGKGKRRSAFLKKQGIPFSNEKEP